MNICLGIESYENIFARTLGNYRVTPKVSYLGWVDLDLECSTILLGQQVATEAAHQPGELPKSSQPNPDLLGHLVMESLSEIIYLLVSEGSASSCETHRISFLAWLPFSVKPWHVHLAYSSSRVTPPVPPGRRPPSWPWPWLTWPSWETAT